MISVGIVDDDAMVRTGLKFILAGENDVSVAWQAGDGAEALTLLESAPVDLLLMDIRMPVLDGLATMEALGQRAARPRVIVLTTFNTDDYVVRALKLGAEGFLLKDEDPEKLVDAIRRVHRGEPSLSPGVTSTLIAVATDAPQANAGARRVAEQLTQREREVAELLTAGLTNAQIASRLQLTHASVKAHIGHIFTKLGVDNRVSAAMIFRDAAL